MSSHQRPYQGVTDTWLTPPEVLDAIGPYDDDPAQPGRTNGLIRPWNGFVFLNPPYGPTIGLWLNKLAEHGEGIALTFARTETKWFRKEVWKRADALLFLYGRLHFLHEDGSRACHNSGAPSVLIGYGVRAGLRLSQCGLPGAFVYGWRS